MEIFLDVAAEADHKVVPAERPRDSLPFHVKDREGVDTFFGVAHAELTMTILAPAPRHSLVVDSNAHFESESHIDYRV